ncbi:Regulatory protein RecX (fragment) [Candidatus Nitrosotalea okcheonensis]|uniref:Regulatory protein RecX n=1 Tax=Candidatus Nitrosotalea okcheonensis TaxID=1903276 RepID=A0A2H1FEV8_9ARCH
MRRYRTQYDLRTKINAKGWASLRCEKTCHNIFNMLHGSSSKLFP